MFYHLYNDNFCFMIFVLFNCKPHGGAVGTYRHNCTKFMIMSNLLQIAKIISTIIDNEQSGNYH